MSILGDSIGKIVEPFSPLFEGIKRRILGANNERIDFLMDSFYKLSPSNQTAALIGACGAVFLIVLMIFIVYFSRIYKKMAE